MNDVADIEQVVREVMRRLSVQQENGEPKSKQNGYPSGELRLSGRVVSLAQVEGRLGGIRRVVAQRNAIVTPAVRDLLRERNVELELAGVDAAQPTTGRRLAVGVAGADVAIDALIEGMSNADVQRVVGDGLPGVVDKLADNVERQSRSAVLLTSRPLLAVCLANRRRTVRAASVNSPEELQQAIDEIDMNFLVLDTRGRSQYLLKRLIETFADAGAG